MDNQGQDAAAAADEPDELELAVSFELELELELELDDAAALVSAVDSALTSDFASPLATVLPAPARLSVR